MLDSIIARYLIKAVDGKIYNLFCWLKMVAFQNND